MKKLLFISLLIFASQSVAEWTEIHRVVGKTRTEIFYVDFENIGGLNSPLPILMTFEDGTNELMTIPAEIWRRSYKKVTKLIIRNKKIISIELDPRHETADTDFSNNFFPSRITKSRIELYKSNFKRRDLMADMLEKLRKRKTGNDDSLRSIPLENTN